MSLLSLLKNEIRPYLTIHAADGTAPLILSAIPRGGSTWMMELVGTLPGVRMIAEPCNVRLDKITKSMQIASWESLADSSEIGHIVDYFDRIDKGEVRFLNPNPFTQMRFLTRRTLFKVIHLPVHIAASVSVQLNAKFLVLIRHPIPVAHSRKVFPMLDSFLESGYSNEYSAEQRLLAREIIRSENKLEQGVLAWCLHFCKYLELIQNDLEHNVISYEESVLDPDTVISKLEQILDITLPESVKKRVLKPSKVLSKSDAETQAVLRSKQDDSMRAQFLVDRWKSRVDPAEIVRVQEILDTFDVKAYRADSSHCLL